MTTVANNFRVRFCPSPSGAAGMHIGNAKTALFNYLFAQKYKADLVLRIEDTDAARVIEGGADNMLADLTWLGIKPNMGYGTDNKPAGAYTQMERLSSYQEIAHRLVKEGKAYKCYCSQEELDKKREEATAKDPKTPFKYPGTCRSITEDLDKPYVIRFKAPTEGCTEFTDTSFGKRLIPNKENYDFVLLRQNGHPLYNFAVVIDDGITDKITHVIRGSDHLKNMVQQELLYRALNLPSPIYTHLTMVLGPNGSKLSKRDASVGVSEYRASGYSPAAVLNYLVKFGWGYSNQELFSLDDLIEKFTLEACNCRDGKFDPIKFASINYSHLKSETLTPTPIYTKHLKAILDTRNVVCTAEQLEPFVPVIRSRAKTFVEAADFTVPMLAADLTPTPDLLSKTFNATNTAHIQWLNAMLSTLDNWNETTLRDSIQGWLGERTLSLKDVGGALRTSLLGTTNSPDIFSVMGALGKTKSLQRLNNALNQLGAKH